MHCPKDCKGTLIPDKSLKWHDCWTSTPCMLSVNGAIHMMMLLLRAMLERSSWVRL